jgi:PIN domain nuclease of toxin-antitoxin system
MGVSYLLDTHVFLWLVDEHGPVPRPEVADPLLDPENRLVVSAVSAFEIATKLRLGKLEKARQVASTWPRPLGRLSAQELAITADHGLAAGGLVWDHRDPFDRLLVAQALLESLTLVTADIAMTNAPGIGLLRW